MLKQALLISLPIFLAAAPSSRAADLDNPRFGFPLPPPEEIGRIDNLPNVVNRMILSRDGKTLFAAGSDGGITAWDMATRAKLKEMQAPSGTMGSIGNIQALTLSADGTRLVAGTQGGEVIVWDAASGRALREAKLPGMIHGVAVSPNGKTVLAAGWASPIAILDTASGTVTYFDDPKANHGYQAVAFLDDNHAIAGRIYTGMVVWELTSGRSVLSFGGTADGGLEVDFTGHWLVSTPANYSVSVWSKDEIEKAIAGGSGAEIHGVVHDNYGDQLQKLAYLRVPFDHWSFAGSSSPDGLDPRQNLVWQTRKPGPIAMMAEDLTADGKTAVVSYRDRTIRVLDLSRIQTQNEWRVANESVSNLAVSADGEWLLATDPNGKAAVWKPSSGKALRSPQSSVIVAPRFGVAGFDFARPGVLLMQGSRAVGLASGQGAAGDGSTNSFLKLVDLQTGKPIRQVPAPGRLWCACSDRTGRLILAGFVSPGIPTPTTEAEARALFSGAVKPISALQIYDQNLNSIGEFGGHLQSGVRAATFSPKATRVATLGADGNIRAFDTKTRQEISPEPLSISDAADVVITDDNLFVVPTSGGSLGVYNAVTGQKVAFMAEAHSKPIVHAVLSPDGKMAATLGLDGIIKLWSLPDLKAMGGFEGAIADPYSNALLFMDNKTIAATSPGGSIRVWKTADAIDFARWDVHAGGAPANCVAVSPDGTRIALGDSAGVLYLIDADTNKELAAVPAHSGGVRSVQFSGQTHQVVSYGADGEKAWNLEKSPTPLLANGSEPPAAEDQPNGLKPSDRDLFLNPDGGTSDKSIPMEDPTIGPYVAGTDWLVTWTRSGIWIVDIKRRCLIWGYDIVSPIRALAIDPSHREMVSAHEDGIVRRWALPQAHRVGTAD